jgi:hypothetical protein
MLTSHGSLDKRAVDVRRRANGDQAGVRLRKAKSEKLLDERERAEAAKTLAREWTAYCKENNSMAFASANGDLILIQFQKVGSGEVLNLLTVRVLDRGLELERSALGLNRMGIERSRYRGAHIEIL